MVNETAIGAIPSLVNTIKALVGGIFGLYLILIFLRWNESRKLVKIMKDIRYDVRKIADKLGVKKTSETKKSKLRTKIQELKAKKKKK